jgi:hypothetical protein
MLTREIRLVIDFPPRDPFVILEGRHDIRHIALKFFDPATPIIILRGCHPASIVYSFSRLTWRLEVKPSMVPAVVKEDKSGFDLVRLALAQKIVHGSDECNPIVSGKDSAVKKNPDCRKSKHFLCQT